MTKPTQVLLEFDPALAREDEKKPLRDGLSVATRTGRNLWTASDEGTMLERLTEVKPGRFARHARFDLHDYLDLPGDADDEVDIEGMGFDDGYLWLVGSHGLTRKKVKKKQDERANLERLATVTSGPNRYLLARIPCTLDEGGDHVLARESEGRVAAMLAGDEDGNALTDAIADDEHLAPFLEIPGKDNGFDIEGLSVANGRVYVGLRGPVLRGWAVVLSLVPQVKDDDPAVLTLATREVARTGKDKKVERCYAKHFIDVAGMGIRELRATGKDLLVLAGPTMQLDGTIAVFRWKGGATADRDCIVPAQAVKRLFDVPHGTGADAGKDKAEGMTLWPAPRGQAKELLVVYDSPSDRRLRGEAGVLADLFPLASTTR